MSKKNNYSIICFATVDTPYVSILERQLEKSCKNFKLKTYFATVPNLHNWYRNTAYKPKFILDALNNLKRDVVWIDADATIEKYPILFDIIPKEYDIALHNLSWRKWYGHDSDTKELLTGTMYFRNRQVVKDLCQEWYDKSNADVTSNIWEQKILQNIIGKYPIKIYELPIEYIYITTRPNGLPSLIKCDPVIKHYQASREWKRKIPILNILNRRNK